MKSRTCKSTTSSTRRYEAQKSRQRGQTNQQEVRRPNETKRSMGVQKERDPITKSTKQPHITQIQVKQVKKSLP